MSMLHMEDVDSLLTTVAPEGDEVLAAMEERADREGFPTVGREVGPFLRVLAHLTDARRVFEFGSGFGYSAYWVVPALGPDGQVVLTEFDEENLERAREYFERGGYADRATFEAGDAMAAIERYDGPFDVVLVDHQNERYVDGFEAVRDKVAPGGVVVADNVLHSAGEATFESADLQWLLEDGDATDASPALAGIAEYYRRVRDDPAFETAVLPVGEGLLVSVRT